MKPDSLFCFAWPAVGVPLCFVVGDDGFSFSLHRGRSPEVPPSDLRAAIDWLRSTVRIGDCPPGWRVAVAEPWMIDAAERELAGVESGAGCNRAARRSMRRGRGVH